MATISSHTLDGLDGSHAGGVPVKLQRLDTGKVLFKTEMDAGGRLAQIVELEDHSTPIRCELIFETGHYWTQRHHASFRIIDEIVLRFTIDDPVGTYHMPIIISPFGYSTWKSG